MDILAESNFDSALLKENQLFLVNVDREKLDNKNLRMNERIFKENLAFTGKEPDPDPFRV